MRPFTILSTTLTLTPNSFADAVPPFDPLTVTSGAAEKADAPPDPGPVAGRRRSRLFADATSPPTKRSPPPAN